MEQLSFKFAQESNISNNKTVSGDDLILEANKLAFEYDELLRKIILISGSQALDMVRRGDFYDTDFEGSLLHSKLQRIAAMLNW